MFEKRDILYNEYSRDYHNKNKRKEVIMKIGQEVQMTGIYTAHYVLVGTFSYQQCFSYMFSTTCTKLSLNSIHNL